MYRLGLLYRKSIKSNPASVTIPAGVFCLVFSPSEVAHLATVKEQSRKDKRLRTPGSEMSFSITGPKGNRVVLSGGPFSKTSIKQYLPVLAMSDLTTSDLENLPISIVTPVDDHQSFNTAPGEVRVKSIE